MCRALEGLFKASSFTVQKSMPQKETRSLLKAMLLGYRAPTSVSRCIHYPNTSSQELRQVSAFLPNLQEFRKVKEIAQHCTLRKRWRLDFNAELQSPWSFHSSRPHARKVPASKMLGHTIVRRVALNVHSIHVEYLQNRVRKMDEWTDGVRCNSREWIHSEIQHLYGKSSKNAGS